MTMLDLVPTQRPATGINNRMLEAPVPTSFRGVVISGLVLLGVTFGGLGTWAALAPLSSAAIASGVLTVASNNKLIQHLEGGIVKEIKVKEGDIVAAGDTLVVLDPTRAEAQVDIVRGQLDATLALEARLLAERSGADTVRFPESLTQNASDPDVAAIIESQKKLFEARKLSLEGQITILRKRIVQAREQIGGLEAQRDSNDRQITLIEDELKGLRELYDKGYAPRTRILALEREASRLLGERGQYGGEVSRVQQVIGETELQIIQVRKNFQEEVAKQLQETQNQIFDLRERLRAAEDVLTRTVVTSPEAGKVTGLKVHTVGGVVPPGDVMLQIVPDNDDLIIEAQLQVTDVDNVHVGQEADVHLTAFSQRVTPVVTGTVANVSGDRFQDQRTGLPYYTVRIIVSEEEREKLGDLQLLPGMPADAYIKTGEKTPLRYLFDPLIQVINRSFREN